MKKKVGIVLLTMVIALCVVALAGCGKTKRSGTALKWAYDDLNKLAKKNEKVDVKYIKKLDQLNITIESYGDPNKVFKTLNKDIKNQDVGILYFGGYYSLDAEDKTVVLKQIGKLQCKSIKVLGLDDMFYEYSERSWMDILPKVDTLYTDKCEYFKNYDAASKQKVGTVNKLWLKDTFLTRERLFVLLNIYLISFISLCL